MSPHEVLGVPAGADEDAIRKAFRKKALQWHPDRNPSPEATTRFQECVDAYETLRGRRAAPPIEPPVRTERPRRARRRGADVDLSFRVASSARGRDARLQVERDDICTACDGPWVGTTCPGCLGSGLQKVLQTLLRIGLESTIRCEVCGGAGLLPPDDCTACYETGVVGRSDWVTVPIPRDGSFVHLAELGLTGLSGGRRGDLNVTVELTPGLDVAVPQDVASSGGRIHLDTPAGPIRLRIPAGSRTGQRLRLRGRAADGTDLQAVLRLTTGRKQGS
ncbi:MAG: J domain-containing protein [Proteobacteria bacterium]|nr:J domain-containing protein [Pseudomonadota bacterium]MCP4919197.1 J domain-containing protein [Pseudomonadota bacterium]